MMEVGSVVGEFYKSVQSKPCADSIHETARNGSFQISYLDTK